LKQTATSDVETNIVALFGNIVLLIKMGYSTKQKYEKEEDKNIDRSVSSTTSTVLIR